MPSRELRAASAHGAPPSSAKVLYESQSKVQVQEYERPDTVDAGKAERRLYDAVSAIPEVLGVRPQDVVLKVPRPLTAGS